MRNLTEVLGTSPDNDESDNHPTQGGDGVLVESNGTPEDPNSESELGTSSDPTTEQGRRFEAVADVYREWLDTQDLMPLQFVLGSIAANRFDADPVWPMLVGGPGSGKSDLVRSLKKIPRVYELSTVTEAGLLSGVSKTEVRKDSTGGLLKRIGSELGYIVLKDFGSILSMNRDQRAGLLAALREIYDGAWTRAVGSDGGKELSWSGKVSFIAGATGAIDLHHAAMASLGERWVYFRMKSERKDRTKQGASALSHIGRTTKGRDDLAESIGWLFNPFPPLPDIQEFLTEERRQKLVALANLTSMARSAVERDGYSREIILVPDPESPTRVASSLSLLLGGMIAIGISEVQAWTVIVKVAFDSIPEIRRVILAMLLATSKPMTMSALEKQGQLKCSRATVNRAMEEVKVHGLIEVDAKVGGEEKPYCATDWSRTQYRLAGLEKPNRTKK